MISEVAIAVFIATLLAVAVRTYVVFLLKQRDQGELEFDARFHLTAFVSILLGSISPAMEIFLGYQILPEWVWWEAFLIVFLAVSGLNGLINRWGITAFLKRPESIVPTKLYEPPEELE